MGFQEDLLQNLRKKFLEECQHISEEIPTNRLGEFIKGPSEKSQEESQEKSKKGISK